MRSACCISNRAVAKSRKADEIEAIAGVDACFERGKPFVEQACRMSRGSRSGSDAPTAMRLTAPSTRNSNSSQRPCAFAAPFEIPLEARCQHEHQPFDILDQSYRFGEMPLDRKRRRPAGAAIWLLLSCPAPGRAVTSSCCAEAAGKRRARGAAITAPTVRRPTLSRLARMPGSRRKAASGRGSRKCSSCPVAENAVRR